MLVPFEAKHAEQVVCTHNVVETSCSNDLRSHESRWMMTLSACVIT